MELLIKLNDKQADVIRIALDLWARIGTGDLTSLLHHPEISRRLVTDKGVTTEDVRRLLESLSESVFDLPPDTYFGIRSPQIGEGNRIAFDLMQVFRHRLAWLRAGEPPKRTPEMASGSYDDPFQTSSEPMALIRQKPNDPL